MMIQLLVACIFYLYSLVPFARYTFHLLIDAEWVAVVRVVVRPGVRIIVLGPPPLLHAVSCTR